MFKTMLKKQLLSFKNFFVSDRKTGKRKSTIKIIGYVLLIALIFVSLGMSMFAIAFLIGDSLLDGSFMGGNRFDWLYFAIMGVMTLSMGVLGSVFTTYQSIYKAKDNDLLLSMPIKPEYIIGSRLFSVALLALAYSMIVWIPTLIVYWIIKLPTIYTIVVPILLSFVNTLLIVTVTCVLGYLVAIISSKFPRNNFLTIALYIVFFGAYYYFCFNIDSLIESMIANLEGFGSKISTWVYPIYLMGKGAAGDPMSLVAYVAFVGLLTIATWVVLKRTFVNIAIANKGEKKVKYVEKEVSAKSIGTALANREFKHFTSSTAYMLNTGMGIPMALIACVMAIIKRNDLIMIKDMFVMEMPFIQDILPAIVVAFVFMLISSTDVTAPSISLEGKNLWVIRSMPIDTIDILRAKSKFGITLNLVPSLLMMIVLSLVLGLDWQMILLMGVITYLLANFSADLGLMLNLLRPSLDWNNEVEPIKQSLPVFVTLLGGWALSVGIGAAAYFLRNIITGLNFLFALMVILVVLCRLMKRWISTKGVEIFESL